MSSLGVLAEQLVSSMNPTYGARAMADASDIFVRGNRNYAPPARDFVDRVAQNSPTAMCLENCAFRATMDITFEQSIATMRAQFGAISLTGDSREGIASFNEKRDRDWTGH